MSAFLERMIESSQPFILCVSGPYKQEKRFILERCVIGLSDCGLFRYNETPEEIALSPGGFIHICCLCDSSLARSLVRTGDSFVFLTTDPITWYMTPDRCICSIHLRRHTFDDFIRLVADCLDPASISKEAADLIARYAVQNEKDSMAVQRILALASRTALLRGLSVIDYGTMDLAINASHKSDPEIPVCEEIASNEEKFRYAHIVKY